MKNETITIKKYHLAKIILRSNAGIMFLKISEEGIYVHEIYLNCSF